MLRAPQNYQQAGQCGRRALLSPGYAELINERFPPGRERDVGRSQGGGFKNSSLSLRLKDTKILPDFKTLTFFGEAKATLEIPTEYPEQFDSPTEINLKLTSTSISPSDLCYRDYVQGSSWRL